LLKNTNKFKCNEQKEFEQLKQIMDLSQLKWIKNVNYQNKNKHWAYNKLDEMSIPEAKIFCLNWQGYKDKLNAQQPFKGDLMLLLQRAKVTHVVEFLDDEVYENDQPEWGIYRIVKALWMPPKNLDWKKFPHQRFVFGFNHLVGDGKAHCLASANKMPQFHQYWDHEGGLSTFQKHLDKILSEIILTSE
jgi:hypothetical protein